MEDFNDKIIDLMISKAFEKEDEAEKAVYEEYEYIIKEIEFDDTGVKSIINDYKRKNKRKKLIKALPKAAAIFLAVLISTASVSLLSVEAFRSRFFEFVEWVGTEFFSLKPNDTEELVPVYEQILKYLPEGFKLMKEYSGLGLSFWEYKNNDNEYLVFQIDNQITYKQYYNNNEKTEIVKTFETNKEVYIVEKNDNYLTLIWYGFDKTYKINTNMEQNTILDLIDLLAD